MQLIPGIISFRFVCVNNAAGCLYSYTQVFFFGGCGGAVVCVRVHAGVRVYFGPCVGFRATGGGLLDVGRGGTGAAGFKKGFAFSSSSLSVSSSELSSESKFCGRAPTPAVGAGPFGPAAGLGVAATVLVAFFLNGFALRTVGFCAGNGAASVTVENGLLAVGPRIFAGAATGALCFAGAGAGAGD